MTDRILPYIAAVICMVSAAAGCEQANVYSDVDFRVTLDPSNTYRVGDPVVFNIDGNPDNLLFYSGEDGHEYRYKDRYQTSVDNVDSVLLFLQIQHRSGIVNDGNTELKIYCNADFEGLKGVESEDRPLVESMIEEADASADASIKGWTRIPYDKPDREQDVYDTVLVKFTDNSIIAENFCLAFYWDTPEFADAPDKSNLIMDTFYVNGDLTVYYPGGVEMTYSLNSMMGTVFMLDNRFKSWTGNRLGTPYYYNGGNGTIRLDAQQDIVFAGGNYMDNVTTPDVADDGIPFWCRGWIFSAPRPFLNIEPDQPEVVKNLQNRMSSFEYTYGEPGAFKVTFVGANENYQGSSSKVQEFTLNIVPPVVQVPDKE